MLKIFGGIVAGIVFTGVLAWNMAGSLMFNEHVSPFGMEETVARIQHNIQDTGKGWSLSGLRNPAKAVQNDGKVYIGNMNAGLMGKMFGPLVGDIMGQVAEDQKKFLVMDPNKPAPQMIVPKPAGEGGGGGPGGGSGC